MGFYPLRIWGCGVVGKSRPEGLRRVVSDYIDPSSRDLGGLHLVVISLPYVLSFGITGVFHHAFLPILGEFGF